MPLFVSEMIQNKWNPIFDFRNKFSVEFSDIFNQKHNLRVSKTYERLPNRWNRLRSGLSRKFFDGKRFVFARFLKTSWRSRVKLSLDDGDSPQASPPQTTFKSIPAGQPRRRCIFFSFIKTMVGARCVSCKVIKPDIGERRSKKAEKMA